MNQQQCAFAKAQYPGSACNDRELPRLDPLEALNWFILVRLQIAIAIGLCIFAMRRRRRLFVRMDYSSASFHENAKFCVQRNEFHQLIFRV